MLTVSEWTDPSFGSVRFATFVGKSDPHTTRVRTSWAPDPEVYMALGLLGQTDAHLIDLGANIGTWCLPVAMGSRAKVLAVEALPDNVAALRHAVLVNALETRVSVMPVAVMDKTGTVRMIGDSAYGTVSDKGDIVVPALPLDEIARDLGDIGVVKIDIEGSEMAAFKGGRETLGRTETVFFEGNGAHCLSQGYMPQDLVRILEDDGFVTYMVHGRTYERVTSTSFQPFGLINYVATRRQALSVDGFSERPMPREIVQKAIHRALHDMKPGYGRFMRAQAARADIDIPSWAKSLLA